MKLKTWCATQTCDKALATNVTRPIVAVQKETLESIIRPPTEWLMRAWDVLVIPWSAMRLEAPPGVDARRRNKIPKVLEVKQSSLKKEK